jgi:chromosome segregation ATPase
VEPPPAKEQARVPQPETQVAVPGEAERARLFRRLAELLRPEGRAPDYRTALQELEAHLALRPADRDEPAIASLAALLREVDRSEGEIRAGQLQAKIQADTIQGLQQQIGRLERAGGDARVEIERLTAENKKLKATVERLQALEMLMEEKRKRVR